MTEKLGAFSLIDSLPVPSGYQLGEVVPVLCGYPPSKRESRLIQLQQLITSQKATIFLDDTGEYGQIVISLRVLETNRKERLYSGACIRLFDSAPRGDALPQDLVAAICSFFVQLNFLDLETAKTLQAQVDEQSLTSDDTITAENMEGVSGVSQSSESLSETVSPQEKGVPKKDDKVWASFQLSPEEQNLTGLSENQSIVSVKMESGDVAFAIGFSARQDLTMEQYRSTWRSVSGQTAFISTILSQYPESQVTYFGDKRFISTPAGSDTSTEKVIVPVLAEVGGRSLSLCLIYKSEHARDLTEESDELFQKTLTNVFRLSLVYLHKTLFGNNHEVLDNKIPSRTEFGKFDFSDDELVDIPFLDHGHIITRVFDGHNKTYTYILPVSFKQGFILPEPIKNCKSAWQSLRGAPNRLILNLYPDFSHNVTMIPQPINGNNHNSMPFLQESDQGPVLVLMYPEDQVQALLKTRNGEEKFKTGVETVLSSSLLWLCEGLSESVLAEFNNNF